jgi:Uma2 family endonuclease
MRTLDELKGRKKQLGYTNAVIAEKSKVPLATVQKVFSGATKNPRWETLAAIEKVLYEYTLSPQTEVVREVLAEYDPSYEKKLKDNRNERWPRQGEYTLEDYYALPDDVRAELIDGVIYYMTAPRRIHQEILGQLYLEFSGCIEKHNKRHGSKCKVYFAPVDVRLFRDDRNMFEPDLIVLCHEDNNEMRIEGAPEFVLEVLSDSTRSKDCLLKLNKYLQAGVHEYWIVDPRTRKIFAYDFKEDVLPEVFTFSDMVPVSISGGECKIDFRKICAAVGW